MANSSLLSIDPIERKQRSSYSDIGVPRAEPGYLLISLRLMRHATFPSTICAWRHNGSDQVSLLATFCIDIFHPSAALVYDIQHQTMQYNNIFRLLSVSQLFIVSSMVNAQIANITNNITVASLASFLALSSNLSLLKPSTNADTCDCHVRYVGDNLPLTSGFV